MKVVIVGGGAGGISTASNLRRLDKEVEIIVLTRDTYCQIESIHLMIS